MKRTISIILTVVLVLSCTSCAISYVPNDEPTTKVAYSDSISNVVAYDGQPYTIINNNIPEFDESMYTTTSYEAYGELDALGRCTSCIASIGTDLMPTEKRGNIGMIKPTGWHTAKYENVDGKMLYNRCHLIGYQLTAENANECNLITGTRYLNVDGMLPFEDEVADYIHETDNHVLYRVTPIFKDSELVARGVQMEAYSIEDNGKGVQYNVYCYNVQPGITIDYQTGESKADSEENNFDDGSEKMDYIVNMKSKKFHRVDCEHAEEINPNNKKKYNGTRKSLIDNGYTPCGSCNP